MKYSLGLLLLILLSANFCFAASLEERVAALEAERGSHQQESHHSDDRFHFSGFGSFTASQLSEDALGPYGQTDQISIDPYTLFGLQFAFIEFIMAEL